MANYSTLKAAVADVVKTNGTQAITGANLQAVLLSIINSVGGGGYIFAGVATPSTDAGTPDQNVFYIGGAGTYANFGTSVTVPVGSICVFKYNGSWVKEQIETMGYVNEVNISAAFPTDGTNGTNKYSFASANAKFPASLRKQGARMVFISDGSDASLGEGVSYTFVHNGSQWSMQGEQRTYYEGILQSDLFYSSIFIPSGKLFKLTNNNTSSVGYTCTNLAKSQTQSFAAFPAGKSVVAFANFDIYYIKCNTPYASFKIELIDEGDALDLTSLLMQQGFYSTINGEYNKNSTTLICTTNKHNLTNKIVIVPSGYLIRSQLAYSESGSYISGNVVDARAFLVEDGYYTFNVKKESGADINPSEFMRCSDELMVLDDISEINNYIKTEYAGTMAESSVYVPVFVKTGKICKLTNTSSNTCNITVWDETKTTRELFDLAAGKSVAFISTFDIYFVKSNLGNSSFNLQIIDVNDTFDLSKCAMRDGAYVVTDGTYTDTNTSAVCTINTWHLTDMVVYVPSGFLIRSYVHYNEDSSFIEGSMVGNRVYYVEEGYYGFTVQNTAYTALTTSDFIKDIDIQHIYEHSADVPMSRFDFDTTLLDVSEEMSGIDMMAVDATGCYTFQDQIIAKIDSLVSSYPSVLTKYDLGTFTDIAYPDYANLGGVASGGYMATPTYRTYMYKYSTTNATANKKSTATKKKVMVIAGLHGWENASQFNTSVLLSKLCKGSLSDYMSLRASCDFYVIPTLNGYSAYHAFTQNYQSRKNANGIDLNRNFPAYNWQVIGTPSSVDYSGTSPASEFETQLIVKAVELIKPDIIIDHHSYSFSGYDYYVEVNNEVQRKIQYQNLYEWTYRMCKDYPTYYGTDGNIYPNGFSFTQQTLSRWGYEVGVPVSNVVEVCLGCNVYNGLPATSAQYRETEYGEMSVKANELMLRLSLTKYADYTLRYNEKTGLLVSSLLID